MTDAIDDRFRGMVEGYLHQQDGSGAVFLRAARHDALTVLAQFLEQIRRQVGHGGCLRRPQKSSTARPLSDVAPTARINPSYFVAPFKQTGGGARDGAPAGGRPLAPLGRARGTGGDRPGGTTV